MKRKIMYTVFILGLISVFGGSAFSGMSSENFRITTSVLSGGGEPMASANYQTNSTAGQPSPLMDPDDPSWSINHDLYPGFCTPWTPEYLAVRGILSRTWTWTDQTWSGLRTALPVELMTLPILQALRQNMVKPTALNNT